MGQWVLAHTCSPSGPPKHFSYAALKPAAQVGASCSAGEPLELEGPLTTMDWPWRLLVLDWTQAAALLSNHTQTSDAIAGSGHVRALNCEACLLLCQVWCLYFFSVLPKATCSKFNVIVQQLEASPQPKTRSHPGGWS